MKRVAHSSRHAHVCRMPQRHQLPPSDCWLDTRIAHREQKSYVAVTLTAGGKNRGSTARWSMMQGQKSSPPQVLCGCKPRPQARIPAGVRSAGQTHKGQVAFGDWIFRGFFYTCKWEEPSRAPANGSQLVTLEHCRLPALNIFYQISQTPPPNCAHSTRPQHHQPPHGLWEVVQALSDFSAPWKDSSASVRPHVRLGAISSP